ncbi:MAG TPA: hypothetical protein VGL02_15495 [Streptomyces sp.]
MRIRTLAANILLPSGIALTVAVSWFWATGDFHPPVRTVVGLALLSAGLAVSADWAARHAGYALRRRGGPSRHRKPAPSRPLAEHANPLTTTPEGEA